MDDPATDVATLIAGLVILAICVFFYLLPGIVASNRKHPQAGAIWVLTLCLGWTLVGWVVALVWASTNSQRVVLERPAFAATPPPAPAPRSAAEEIEQFARLKNSGVISAEEFEAKKRQLLGLTSPATPTA